MRKHIVNLENLKPFTVPVCACIGYFDGMHKGHQELISKTVRMAAEKGCESALITFEPDPWVAIKGVQNIRHISTMRQRVNRAIDLGIENIIILSFTREMSLLSPEEFTRKVLKSIALKGLVCGFDFHYGYLGAGNPESLQAALDCEVIIVEQISDEGGKISSTRISEAIENGDIIRANSMLGYSFEIEGIVMHGAHKGTGIGFPTINLNFSDEYLLPKTGVYAGFVKIVHNRYKAMINVGHNPTFNYQKNISIEAHLFDFYEMLYGRHVTFQFEEYIRPEKKFQSRNNLILQLEQDAYSIKRKLARYE